MEIVCSCCAAFYCVHVSERYNRRITNIDANINYKCAFY